MRILKLSYSASSPLYSLSWWWCWVWSPANNQVVIILIIIIIIMIGRICKCGVTHEIPHIKLYPSREKVANMVAVAQEFWLGRLRILITRSLPLCEYILCSFDVTLALILLTILTWPIQDVFFCPSVNIFVWIQNTFVCDVANRICSFEIQPDCVLSNTTIFHSSEEIKLNCVLLKQPLLWWLRALSLLMDNNLVKTWISLAWIGKLFVCDTSYSWYTHCIVSMACTIFCGYDFNTMTNLNIHKWF